MKKNQIVMFLLSLAALALLLVGCGDSCTQDDSRACTTTFSTCTSSCNPLSGYKDCTDKCKKSYCECLDSAGCDTSASGGTC